MKCPYCGYDENSPDTAGEKVIKGLLGLGVVVGAGWLLLGPIGGAVGTGIGATLYKRAVNNTAKGFVKKLNDQTVRCPKCHRTFLNKDNNTTNNKEEK